MKKKTIFLLLLVFSIFLTSALVAAPEETKPTTDPVLTEMLAKIKKLEESKANTVEVDWLWTVIAGVLVFFMQAGFGLVEAGFTRAKNAVNIMMKNYADMSFGVLAFWFVGFGLMFGANAGGYFGTEGFMFDPAEFSKSQPENWSFSFFFFQSVFAATAATIVSGAIAERTKFSAYIILSIMICAFIYPISGSWAWGSLYNGEGWLEKVGLNDFAGSSVVHAAGGFAALAAAIVVGPRKGKFLADGKVGFIPGHNIPFAAIGVLILWMGWFGFNAGSTTSLDGGNFGRVAAVTMLAAVSGFVGAIMFSLFKFKKFDASFAVNGVLAGLVSITAGCYSTGFGDAIMLGLIGGVLVCLSVIFFDKIKVDDPVGAISVHGVVGIWGTVGLAIFNSEKDGVPFSGQLIGSLSIAAWAFFATLIVALIIKYTIGIRVSEKEEIEGLDLGEHGYEAYPNA